MAGDLAVATDWVTACAAKAAALLTSWRASSRPLHQTHAVTKGVKVVKTMTTKLSTVSIVAGLEFMNGLVGVGLPILSRIVEACGDVPRGSLDVVSRIGFLRFDMVEC